MTEVIGVDCMVVVFTCGKKTILQQTSNDSALKKKGKKKVLHVSLFVYLAIKEVIFHSPVFIKGIPKCLYIVLSQLLLPYFGGVKDVIM